MRLKMFIAATSTLNENCYKYCTVLFTNHIHNVDKIKTDMRKSRCLTSLSIIMRDPHVFQVALCFHTLMRGNS